MAYFFLVDLFSFFLSFPEFWGKFSFTIPHLRMLDLARSIVMTGKDFLHPNSLVLIQMSMPEFVLYLRTLKVSIEFQSPTSIFMVSSYLERENTTLFNIFTSPQRSHQPLPANKQRQPRHGLHISLYCQFR